MVAKKKQKPVKRKKIVKRPKPKKILKLTPAQKKARNKIYRGKIYSRYAYEKKFGRKKSTRNLREFRGHLGRYYSLVRDYIEKKKQKGIHLKPRQAMQSEEMKRILVDIHKGQALKQRGNFAEGNKLLRNALKKTTRRDGIPDTVIVGESPK